MGNSFVDEETRRAVETELGRLYWGSIPKATSGENREDVRKRMIAWKANVDTAQRITVHLLTSFHVKSQAATYGRRGTETQSAVAPACLDYSVLVPRPAMSASQCAPMSDIHQRAATMFQVEEWTAVPELQHQHTTEPRVHE